MAEADQAGGSAGQNDKTRTADSVAAEMNRKYDKLSQENQKLSDQLNQLTEIMLSKGKASGSQSATDDGDEIGEDEAITNSKKFAEKITNKVTKEVGNILNQQTQQNALLSQMVNEYPELSDASSELTTKAVDIYKKMSAQERSNPMAYKTAVRDAAAEVGLLPKAKRKQTAGADNDQFTFGSGQGGAGEGQRRGGKPKDLDPNTVAVAELFGIKTEDPKVLERLKGRAQRKNWNKYE
jgi:hypothetical protein